MTARVRPAISLAMAVSSALLAPERAATLDDIQKT